jgi:hypothetical protein
MKILASAPNKHFIVDMEEAEVYKIMGFATRFDSTAPRSIESGMVVEVAALWKLVDFMRSNQNTLTGVAETLKHYADMIMAAEHTVLNSIRFNPGGGE